jgi:hypothetical protein
MNFFPRGRFRAFPFDLRAAVARTGGCPSEAGQVLEKLYERLGITRCEEDHGGRRGVAVNLADVNERDARERRYAAGRMSKQSIISIGCCGAKVSLLRDVSGRVKGLFVAVPQIEFN